jgi:thiol-disulfide isomerase/thioredoxin
VTPSIREHARLIALLLSAVALGIFQVRAKPRPDAEEIAERARMFADSSAWEGRIAPDFETALLDGTPLHLADRIGKDVIVLNFFATWCGPCRSEMPELERYANAHKAEGVLLLAIDVEEKHTVVEKFVADLRLTFPVAIDGSGDIGKAYGVSAFPTTVVIGADGRVKLYEVSAIANADVALGGAVVRELASIHDGHGISADAYKRALASDSKETTVRSAPLTGRALRIAEAMTCPCGCEDKVTACSCSTSKGIRARLAANTYDGQTDAQVIEALNREFCVKGGDERK